MAVVLILLCASLSVIAAGPERPPSADEIDSRLDSTRKILADTSRSVEERASIALEEAAALDREAQARPTLDERRARSSQAIRLLDEFNAAHPRHGLETPLALQAAVYVWADGRDASRKGGGSIRGTTRGGIGPPRNSTNRSAGSNGSTPSYRGPIRSWHRMPDSAWPRPWPIARGLPRTRRPRAGKG